MFSMPPPKKKRAPKHTVRTPQQEMQSRGTDFLGSAFRVEDILAINLPPDVRRRTRFLKSGKMQRRYTLEIETEPVLHDLDESRLGRGPAEALAAKIGENIRNSSKNCARATQKLRGWAYRRMTGTQANLAPGAKKRTGADNYATHARLLKRYDGGQIGLKLPDPSSDKLGVDSGRLADNLFARLNRTGRTTNQHSTWTINVPANRLNPETWSGGDGPQFRQWLSDFREMVNLAGAVASAEFQNELADGLAAAIGKLESELWRKRRALFSQYGRLVKGGARLLAVI